MRPKATKRPKGSEKTRVTAKICILVAVLLMASSMMTYMAIVQFLPEYYSMELRTELDRMSGDMVKNISAYSSIEDAFHYIELFEAGAQVGVTILDSRGEEVWPAAEASMDEVMLVQSFGEVQEDNANEEGTNTEAKKETTANLASEDTEKCFDQGVASEMVKCRLIVFSVTSVSKISFINWSKASMVSGFSSDISWLYSIDSKCAQPAKSETASTTHTADDATFFFVKILEYLFWFNLALPHFIC